MIVDSKMPQAIEHIIRCYSPNFSDRNTSEITAIILHHTVGNLTSALKTLTSPEAQVSSHYLVAKDGTIFQLVDEQKKAWHAGVSSWKGNENVNQYSIGIEMENSGFEIYPETQISSVIELCKDLMNIYPEMQQSSVVGHSDVAPGRKIDPAYLFPWKQLAEAGVGIYPTVAACNSGKTLYDTTSSNISPLRQKLSDFGYKISCEDATWDAYTTSAVAAFKRHYHPEIIFEIGEEEASTFWSEDDQMILEHLLEII